MKIRFLRANYFIWVVVPVIVYGVYLAFGLPHMVWNYEWRDDGQGYDPFAERWYLRCTFIGPYGEFTIFPNNGECPWLRFYKQREDV